MTDTPATVIPTPEEAPEGPEAGSGPDGRGSGGGLDHPRRASRAVLEWVAVVVAALAVAAVVKTYLLQAFFIPSASMETTLVEDDRVLVNKLSYRLHDVNRGDVVVFERPDAAGSDPEIKDLIKRVVGLPGEEVRIADGRVLVDGRPLDEPYLAAGTQTFGDTTVTVPPGHLWVMGDNRSNSSDSRVFGAIPEDLVVGRAFVKVWPVTDLELL